MRTPLGLVLSLAVVLSGCVDSESQSADSNKGEIITTQSDGTDKSAECRVFSTASGNKYEGKCLLVTQGDHSFELSRKDEQPFFGRIQVAIIEAEAPTSARLLVLDSLGGKVEYGEAYRESEGSPCWKNDSIDVCVLSVLD